MINDVQIDAIAHATRINLVGTSGSGKSTLGRKLATLKEIPYVEMDQLFWKPDWQESTDAEFLPKVQRAVAGDHWILDGNYHHRTAAIKWSRAQLVLFVDLSFSHTLYRVTKRAFARALSQREIWPGTGNRESLRRSLLSRDSIIWWTATHHGLNRHRYLAPDLLNDHPQTQLVHLNSAAKIDYCLAALKAHKTRG